MSNARKIDTDAMRTLALFEQVTGARVKDCVTFKDRLTFIVEEGQLWRALGKNRANLLKLERLLKQRVKIVEYRPDKIQFIVNLLAPLRIVDIQEGEDGIITIKGPDTKTKGLMIGARAQNLRALEGIVRMYFDCEEIKVV
ncbi:NusA-like transcription termination signal-binding factor [Candidatus Woesearchaeota archaeon]|nr:NusA-like transcription termination signal-binding factor [Candidatus Woesearchaeota archaeon]